MGANYNNGIDLPFSASGDMNTWQYHFVKHAGTAKRVDLATGGSNPTPLGVLQNDPQSGNSAAVRVIGSTLVRCVGAAIGYGDFIAAGSTGMAELTAASTANGIALGTMSAGGASVLIEAFIFPGGWSIIADNTP